MDDAEKNEIQSAVIDQLTEMMDSYSSILETFTEYLGEDNDATVEELNFIGGGMLTVAEAVNMWSSTTKELIQHVDTSLQIAEKREHDQNKFEEIVTHGLNALPVTDPYDVR